MTKTIVAALIATLAAGTVFAADAPATPTQSGAAPTKATETVKTEKHAKAAPKKAAKVTKTEKAEKAEAAPAASTPTVSGSAPAPKK